MAKKGKNDSCEMYVREGCRLLRRGALPAAVAAVTSVMVSSIGPVGPILLIGGGGYAWWKGYRIRVVKPDGNNENGGED